MQFNKELSTAYTVMTEEQQSKADKIMEIVSRYYDIPVDIVKSSTRRREVSWARQVAMYFTLDLLNVTLLNASMQYNRSNHTTSLHAKNTVLDLISYDKKKRSEVQELKDNLTQELESSKEYIKLIARIRKLNHLPIHIAAKQLQL